jgi:hypothetical protein
LRPEPFTPCTADEYVGDDCLCYKLASPLPDLRVDRDAVIDSIYFDKVEFTELSCAYKDGCVTETGLRRLLRFSTAVINQGNGPLVIPEPRLNPHEFNYNKCYDHYDFKGYAEYRLLNAIGNETVGRGHLFGYCVEDIGQHSTQEGPDIPCIGESSCAHPGLLRGYFDVYSAALDCQWIDITGLDAGNYTLRIDINTARQLHESNHENNFVLVQVQIPPQDVTVESDNDNNVQIPVAPDSSTDEPAPEPAENGTDSSSDSEDEEESQSESGEPEEDGEDENNTDTP